MIHAASTRKKTNLLFRFGVGNLLNFAVVKSLRKFGGCLVDNFSCKSRFEINFMVGIVGSDKCNVIAIFSYKFSF